jgi:hypothetical protein
LIKNIVIGHYKKGKQNLFPFSLFAKTKSLCEIDIIPFGENETAFGKIKTTFHSDETAF